MRIRLCQNGNNGNHLRNTGIRGIIDRTLQIVTFATINYWGMKIKRRYMVATVIVACVILAVAAAGVIFINQPSFGRLPRGERLERIKRSPHYRDGAFHNIQNTLFMTSDKGRWESMWDFLFDKPDGLAPQAALRAVKTDLGNLPGYDLMVWFGHSSYLLQLSGKKILVDPVFCMASPVSFVNRPFKGTDIYEPDDIPPIDALVITHDHWDHLDYNTVKSIKARVGKVVCPLGVGEHLEYWGYDVEQIVELDWHEDATPVPGFTFHCLPARHFSGRGLASNKTLWASFLVESPSLNVYIGGDSGYGTHFAEIGRKYVDIDVAILENGQYNEGWKYIHTMPDQLGKAARDIDAETVITVHHSKYALSRHRWDEPLENELSMAREDSVNLKVLEIGSPAKLP